MEENCCNTSSTPGSSTVRSADDFKEELMEIYGWPFSFVLLYAVLGTMGNAIVLYIYYNRYRHTKTRIFIMCLAFLDLCNCVFNMPTEALILWRVMSFDMNGLCKFTRGATFFINNTNALVFIAIGVDRYLLLYRPFQSLVLTVRYAKIACLLSLVGGILTSFPGFIIYGTATVYENIGKEMVVGRSCYIQNQYSLHASWPMVFSTSLFALYIVVFFILSILYIAIGRKIYKVTHNHLDLEMSIVAHSVRRTMSKRKSEAKENDSHVTISPDQCNKESEPMNGTAENLDVNDRETRRRYVSIRRISSVNSGASRAVTIMMIVITVGFMMSFTPYLVIVTIRYINPRLYFSFTVSGKIAYHVLLRSYFLNSVINPIIYGFVNREFRSAVKKTSKNLIPTNCDTQTGVRK